MREDSPTYLKWYGIKLTAENKKQLLIPKGFAHGFLVLSEYAEFCYKVDDFFHPNDEGGIPYDDSTIGVDWNIPSGMELNLSEKDKNWQPLSK
jgi:dTDP-4-dehydrorhamnose 3,5-epimerase